MSKKRKRTGQDAAKAAPASKKQQLDGNNVRKSSKHSAKSTIAPAPSKQTTKGKSSKVVTDEQPREPLDASPFAETPKGADLAREVRLYDLLASEDDVERLDAAQAIITALLPGDTSLVPESVLQRHLERKLFRGLASGRKAARLGFSIALTEILSQLFGAPRGEQSGSLAEAYPGITFEKTVRALQAKTKPEGDLSGQEERDHYFGLLFGLQSFVRAEILFEDDTRFATVLEVLLQLANKKSWMREECGWVIVEALNQMSPQNEASAVKLIEKLCEAGFALTPEGVGIWLVTRQKFPDIRLPTKPWGTSANPMDHLKLLAKALKESANSDSQTEGQAKQSGTWNPKLHFVWDIVIKQYILDAEAGREGVEEDFQTFWKVTVDENLFSNSSSRERKFWGFQLFQKMLEEAYSQPKLLDGIFGVNFMRCLINQLSNQDRFLNRAADKSLKVILQTVQEHPDLLPTILANIVDRNGLYHFDQVTKTKTVERLLAFANNSNGKEVVDALFETTKSPKNEQEAEARRQLFGDTTLAMVRHINFSDESQDHEWVRNAVLPKLALLAYSNDKSMKPAVSQKTRGILQSRLASALAHCLSGSQGLMFPCDLLQEVDPDGIEMDDEITKAKDKALGNMSKLVKKQAKTTGSQQASLRALALLYAIVIFQLYNGEADALSILDELKLCYDKLVRGKDDEEIDESEVIVGVLLSLVSKPSVFLRKAAQSIFAAFTSEITPEALTLMTDVLESTEDLKGQQELFEQEPEGEDVDGEDEGSDSDDDDDELDSDVEVVDVEENEAESDDEEDNEEDDDDNEDGDNEEDKLFDAALAKALGTHRADEDAAASSDSDADMTDSEMMDLDNKLVEIFKHRKPTVNKKQERRDAKEHMANFKARVLDLLEVYIKNEASNVNAFGLLLPLLTLMRSTATKRLSERVPNLISGYNKAMKKDAKDKETTKPTKSSDLVPILKSIHEEASKEPSQSFARAASSASLLVAAQLIKTDLGNAKKVANVYRDTQLAVLLGEVKIRPVFFNDWTNWCQSRGSNEAEK